VIVQGRERLQTVAEVERYTGSGAAGAGEEKHEAAVKPASKEHRFASLAT